MSKNDQLARIKEIVDGGIENIRRYLPELQSLAAAVQPKPRKAKNKPAMEGDEA